METQHEEILEVDLSQLQTGKRFSAIWRLLKGFRLRYCLSILFQGVSIFFKSAVYILLGWFIDVWLPQEIHRIPIIAIALLFVAASCLEGLFSYLSSRWMNGTAESLTRRLRNNFYDQIQRLSFSWHDQVNTGDLIVRATSDIDAVHKLFSEQIYGATRVIFFFLINFALIYQIHAILALTTLIIVPLILFTALFFFKRIAPIYESYQNQDSIVSTVLQENLTGVRVVKAFARQAYEMQKFDVENRKRYQIGKRLTIMDSFFWPASDILCGMQLAISTILGANMAINGNISLGNFISFESLVTLIVWPMRNLGRQIVFMSRSLISFDRLTSIFQISQEPLLQGNMPPKGSIILGTVQYEHVSFSYQDEKIPALEDISFETHPGQVIAIIGSTGSGKSTLLSLLPRFYDYTQGSIKVDGIELHDLPRQYLRSQIGIVEQEPFLFSRTIAGNIAYGLEREASQEEIISAARAADIHDSICAFADGYQTLVGERGVTLSGGQKQRIAIARAILKNPSILILDDSLSAVDTETESIIQDSLKKIMKGRTTFIIAHRIQSIMDADQILVMDKGRIVQSGTHTDLMKVQNGLYRRIYDIQTRIENELEKELSDE